MFSLRSCLSLPAHRRLPLRFSVPRSLHSTRPLPRRAAMSSSNSSSSAPRRNVFEALMSNARAAKKPKSQPPKPPTSNPQNPSSDFPKSTVSDHDNGADSKQLKPNKKKIDGSVSSDSGSKKSPRMRKSPEPEPGNPSMDSPKLSIKELIVKKDGGGGGSSKSESKKSPTKRKSPEPNPISDSPKKGKEVKKKGKVEVVNADERVANLKKKAGEFEAWSAAWWEDKEKVPFLFVAKPFDLVANESERLAITDIVCNLLRTMIEVTPNDLLPVVYKIAPTHKGLKLGIGDASIIKALAVACGRKEEHIKTQFKVDSVNLCVDELRICILLS